MLCWTWAITEFTGKFDCSVWCSGQKQAIYGKTGEFETWLSHDNCPHWIQGELEGGVKCIKEMVPQVIIFINM